MSSRKIFYSHSFQKAYKKFTKNNIRLQTAIDESIEQLQKDTFSPVLRTHKLGGSLYGMFACSCGYDCRIVFLIEEKNNEECIVLVDVGTHKDVY